jgi:putative transposase
MRQPEGQCHLVFYGKGVSETFHLVYVSGMTFPDLSSIALIYDRCAPATLFDYLQKRAGVKVRRGIYSLRVVVWMMILQRLHAKGTLTSAVQLLQQGSAEGLLESCKRVREGRIGCSPGGYCQARQKASTLVVQQVSDEIVQRLRNELSLPWPGLQQSVFVVDGSSVQLAHSKELVEKYPPAKNQHGRAHWPVLRILALHDLSSGLAERPCWGPMFGDQAVSEQELLERAMERLPSGAVLLADRNFGIFSVVYAAPQSHHRMLLRLTEARARKLYGGPISRPGDYPVCWKASRWDGRRRRTWPADASLQGRLIAWRVGRGKSKMWLYLFTDLDLPAQQLVDLYGHRGNIETDLRSLKQTVRLHQIAVKTIDLLEKELYLACSAYNLVRAVMCLAARRANLAPRQLSFSSVLDVVNAAWPRLLAAKSREEHHAEFDRVLDYAASYKLPKRKKRRSYPRAVWGRGANFPSRNEQPNAL